MRVSTRSSALILAGVLLLPALAMAQGSITGSVRDGTGAVLPGVTVEASSPALIEKVRSVISDGSGQYRIVDLRPGTYSVTFTLPGFNTFKREGIELAGSFTATVDADLRVGALEETVTVSGQAPVVDVQSASLQRVLSKDIIDAIPAGRGQSALAVLIPGMTAGGQDVGGTNNQSLSAISIHGGRGTDQRQAIDGMTLRNVAGQGNSTNTVVDVGSSQEMTIDYAAGNAEAVTGGVLFNFVPKEGGNRFSGSFFGTQTGADFQQSNYTDELRAQGLRAPNSLKKLFDYNASVGGPIARDKVWFYSSTRFQRSESYIAGLWENKNAGDLTKWLYEPDFDRQTSSFLKSNSVNSRVTWQASPRNKFNVYFDNSWRYWISALAPAGGVSVSTESAQKYDFPRLRNVIGGWSSPVSNKMLIDVRGKIQKEDIFNFYDEDPNGPYRNLIGVVEQNQVLPGIGSIGTLRYRGRSNTNDTGIAANDQILTDAWEIKGSVSYITGSHALKVGVGDYHGIQTYNSPELNNAYNIRMLNGVPNQITQRQNQYMGIKGGVRAEAYAFVQDRWTVKRLTVNAGLRFDINNTGWDEYTFGPGPLVPNRNFTIPETDFYRFKDLNPRLGAAYDLFGTGRTALKVNLGRYGMAPDPTTGVPARDRIVGRVTRSWIDADADYVPDCDLTNLFAQGPANAVYNSGGQDFCGQVSDLRFGSPVPSTNYDEAILKGWHARPYNWEFSTAVVHEVVKGLGVDVGYFRRTYGNFVVVQNRSVAPTDYNTYSIPIPVDARLPNSGQTLNGIRDVIPSKFGQVDNLVTAADNFGGQSEMFNGVDVNANARLAGITLRGGISTGKVTQDHCAIALGHPEVQVNATVGPPTGPTTANIASTQQSTDYCHVETPFLTQAKLFAIYAVPKIDVAIAATLQNLPGPLITANYIATNAVITPSLGRPLAGGVANTTVNLVQPGAMYGERLNELDLRLSKDFRFGGQRLFRANLDIYNIMNSNPVRTVNAAYASWLVPTAILDPRLFKISAQFDF
jgi:hypothetical protein